MSRVLVAGGGPAGLAAGITLARRGVDVTLCEAGTWPRPKMCGEFLSPDAMHVLEILDAADAVRRLHPPEIGALRVSVARDGRTRVTSTRPLGFVGHGVSRDDLDAILADLARDAGVDVRERFRVTRLTSHDDQMVAESSHGEVKSQAAIVATGRLADLLPAHQRPRGAWVAVKVHVRGVDVPGRTELHFVRDAYVGLNEVTCRGERVVNVCALARRRLWEDAGATPQVLLDRLARDGPSFAPLWTRADPISDAWVAAAGFDFVSRGSAGSASDRVFLVGDAAGLVAPLLGDGQAMALAGGAALGSILAESENDGGLASARRCWRGAFRKSFSRRLALGRAVQRAMLSPRPAAALVAAGTRLPPLASWLLRASHAPIQVQRR